MTDWLAFSVLATLAIAGGWIWAQRALPARIAGIFILGLFLRIVGSIARLGVIEEVYSGVGDAKMYFDFGRAYAELIRSFDFGFMFGEGTMDGRWWGTQFIRTVTGFVVFFTGDSIRAAFLAFALFSFIGLVLCVRAFGRLFGEQAEYKFARWVWLWPTLWFWPCSIGKESIMLLGTGLAIWGYIGRGSPRWLVVAMGLMLTAAVRPHVSAVVAAAVLVSESMGPGSVFSWRRLTGLMVAGAMAAYSVKAGLAQMNLGDADIEGVQEHFEFRAGQTEQGGSQIAMSKGVAAIPMAFITILMRPFLWEARGIALLSALEMSGLWFLVFLRRSTSWQILKSWRSSPFMRFGLVFVLGISLMYGLAFANLGIIARQRAVIIPYLLTLLTGQLFQPQAVPGLDASQVPSGALASRRVRA